MIAGAHPICNQAKQDPSSSSCGGLLDWLMRLATWCQPANIPNIGEAEELNGSPFGKATTQGRNSPPKEHLEAPSDRREDSRIEGMQPHGAGPHALVSGRFAPRHHPGSVNSCVSMVVMWLDATTLFCYCRTNVISTLVSPKVVAPESRSRSYTRSISRRNVSAG